MNRILVFLHIQKTAGSTFRAHLKESMKSREVIWVDAQELKLSVSYSKERWGLSKEEVGCFLSQLPAADKKAIRAICGHFVYRGIEKLLGREADYVTFLREPAARTISHYNYARGRRPGLAVPLTYWPKTDLNAPKSIAEETGPETRSPDEERKTFEKWFLENPVMQNTMTRTIVDWFGGEEVLGDLTEAHLAKARSLLDGFRFVGLTERYDEDAPALYRELGIRRTVENQKVSKRYLAASEETKRLILSKNTLDSRLYEHAARLRDAHRRTLGKRSGALRFFSALFGPQQ